MEVIRRPPRALTPRRNLSLAADQSSQRCTIVPLLGTYLYAVLGDAEQMFECLELLGPSSIATAGTGMKHHPLYPYRDDPRLHGLLRKWNLEDAPFTREEL